MSVDPISHSATDSKQRKPLISKILRQKIGFGFLLGAIVYSLYHYLIIKHPTPADVWDNTTLFIILILVLVALSFIFNFRGILFDPQEYTENKSVQSIVKKLRYRGVLFNNIAIILFLITLLVIGLSFYLLATPHRGTKDDLIDTVTMKIGASVLLIFLVQILFKVFKYLLRVAAFYNARADAIEFNILKENIELEKYMELFTPDRYDISELEKVGLFDGVLESFKAKLGK